MRYTITFILLLFVNLSFARILTVDDDGPADFNNIQPAIDASADGDIIIVQPGLYIGKEKILYPTTLKVNAVDFGGKNITLTSINPSNFDVVSSTVMNATVMFNGTEDSNCLLSGFKIYCDDFFNIIGGDIFEYPQFVLRTKATIKNCFLHNLSLIYSIYSCNGLIENCIIEQNSEANPLMEVIPAVYNCSGEMKNCTIVNNNWGPGIFVGPQRGHLKLENCIIYSNHNGPNYVQLYVSEGNSVSISFCDIQDGLGGIQGGGSIFWGPGNIDKDPCFVRNGFWKTFEGDYHLKSQAGRWDPNTKGWVLDDITSPCIDAGNPGCPLRSEPNDANNIRINIGAFGGTPLASKTPAGWSLLADLTNDGVVDFNDLSYQTIDWLKSGQCLPGDLNRDVVIDFVDVALFASDWLKETIWHEP
jgi:hypothetical protein